MRSSIILGCAALALVTAGFTFSLPNTRVADAEETSEAPLAERLKGTWILVGTPDSVGEIPKVGRLKFYTGNCWCITEAYPETGLVKFHHGGAYKLDGNRMTSIVDYAGESSKERLHTTSNFEIKVEGDTYTQVGLDNPYTEVWKRVK